MKNKIKTLLMGTLLFAVSGCALESEVYDKINPSIFPKTESDIQGLVANVYSVFSSCGYNNLFSMANGVQPLSETVSDIMTCSWGNDWMLLEYNNHTAETGLVNSNLNQFRWYERLGSMILTLDRIQNANVNMTSDMKERYMAETKCGMGFMAFLLYDLYGPIILPDLELLKHPGQDKILPRATEQEMRDFIVTNLTEAAKVLPYSYAAGDYGRFTKGLANTLLLKYYMRVGDWDSAVTIGQELTTNPRYGYQIEDDYYKLFSPTGRANAEIIFAATSSEGGLRNLFQVHVYPGDFPHKEYFPSAPDKVTLWGGYRMAWSYYHTFEAGDNRLERIYGAYTSTEFVKDAEGKDTDVRIERSETNNPGPMATGAVPGKYSIDGMVGDQSGCDLVVYRFSDVKTLYAEALVRKNNTVSALSKEYLNEIRTKHGKLTAFTDAEIGTPEKFLDKMLIERGHEFYMEGVRRQDLIRHGKFIEECKKKNIAAGQSTVNLEKKVDGKYVYELLPLPKEIIKQGQGIIIQNPGF